MVETDALIENLAAVVNQYAQLDQRASDQTRRDSGVAHLKISNRLGGFSKWGTAHVLVLVLYDK